MHTLNFISAVIPLEYRCSFHVRFAYRLHVFKGGCGSTWVPTPPFLTPPSAACFDQGPDWSETTVSPVVGPLGPGVMIKPAPVH